MGIKWTFEMEQELIDRWEAGQSATRISNALPGISRSAVCGKSRRMGLSRRTSPIPGRKYAERAKSTKGAPPPRMTKKDVFASQLAESAGTPYDGAIARAASRIGLTMIAGELLFREICIDLGVEQCV